MAQNINRKSTKKSERIAKKKRQLRGLSTSVYYEQKKLTKARLSGVSRKDLAKQVNRYNVAAGKLSRKQRAVGSGGQSGTG